MILHPRELLIRFDARHGITASRRRSVALTLPEATSPPQPPIGPEKIRTIKSAIAGGRYVDDAILNDLVEAILSSLDAEA